MFVLSLQEITNLRFTYDEEHDILYLYFGEPKISSEEETAPGIFVRLAEEDNSITGAIIMDYKTRGKNKISKHLPVNINFDEINKKIH